VQAFSKELRIVRSRMNNYGKRRRGQLVNQSKWPLLLSTAMVLDSPGLGRTPQDYGGQDSVGLHLKRRWLTHEECELMLDFGVFLGERADGWYVMVKDPIHNPVAIEQFDTLAQLKEAWDLD
jgi:hypothetical protein